MSEVSTKPDRNKINMKIVKYLRWKKIIIFILIAALKTLYDRHDWCPLCLFSYQKMKRSAGLFFKVQEIKNWQEMKEDPWTKSIMLISSGSFILSLQISLKHDYSTILKIREILQMIKISNIQMFIQEMKFDRCCVKWEWNRFRFVYHPQNFIRVCVCAVVVHLHIY